MTLSLKSGRTLLLVALAYFAIGRFGQLFAQTDERIIFIWLPAGLAVAAIYRWGEWTWSGVMLGAIGLGLTAGTPPAVAVSIAVGNTLGPIAAVLVLRRMQFHQTFDRAKDILILAGAAMLGMLVSATIGIASLSVGGLLGPDRGFRYLIWWTGDVLGVMAVAPLLPSFARQDLRAIALRRHEFLAWLVATGLMLWTVFVLNLGFQSSADSLAFVALPFVAWAALRFGAMGTSLALIGLSMVAAHGMALGSGPFVRPNPIEGVLMLSVFTAVSVLLGWMITALNVARHKASATQQLLEKALSDVSMGVLLSDTNRVITHANQGFTRLTGYSEAEVLGKNCRMLQGPATDARVVAEMAAALRDSRGFEGDILNYRKDGTPFWNALLVSPVHDEQGELEGFLGVLRDATDRKHAELALADSSSRLQAALSTIENVVYSTPPDGHTLHFISGSADGLYGRPAADFMRDPTLWLEAIHPDDRANADAAFAAIADTDEFDADYRIVRGDGSIRWVHDQARLLRDDAGLPLRVDGVVSDITERTLAADAVRENAERLRLALTAANQGLYDLDLRTGEAVVSDEYARMLGYDPAEFQETSTAWRERLHPDDRERTYGAYADYIAGRLPEYRVEFRQLTRSGDWKWILSCGGIVSRAADGTPLRMLGTHTDITERKRAEAMSKVERDVLELLSIGSALPEVLTRLALGYEEAFSGATCSIQRLDEAQQRLYVAAAPNVPEAFRAALDQVAFGADAGGSSAAAYLRRLIETEDIATDPQWTAFRDVALAHGLRACIAAPMVSSNDRVLGTFACYRTVPHRADSAEIAALERAARFAALAIERHELAQSLEESRLRLQTLVSHLPGMAYRCRNDASWTMTYCSDGCEALTGYRRDELEGNRVVAYGDLVHPEDREWLWAKCQTSLDARAPCQNEYRIIDRKGRERWVSERASGTYAPSGELLYIDGFIQDITDARQAAEERTTLERKMLETQKLESLGVLAGGIAHDFNNILTGILGNASLGVSDASPGAPEEEYFRDIADSARRAADLCRQMLAYAGKGRFVIHTLDLSELIESTTSMLQLSISKSVVLRFHLGRDLPPVDVDATQIRQVLMNLVINASEAIGDRSGVIGITTGLTRVDRAYLDGTLVAPELPEGDYVTLEVSDSGSGMAADTQARIFDPFFTTKFTGRGLGLAAVLGIVRGHRGALKLYSDVGRGTTFKILFPAASGLAEPSPASRRTPTEWRGSGTVLVVDDEETVRSIVARMLRALGFDVVLAADGEEAVELFRATPDRFTLVLLDLTMPRGNGEQTFAELRKLRPDVRVVLMSGFTEQEALLRFPGKGLASFLQKPFGHDALHTVLQSILVSQR